MKDLLGQEWCKCNVNNVSSNWVAVPLLKSKLSVLVLCEVFNAGNADHEYIPIEYDTLNHVTLLHNRVEG